MLSLQLSLLITGFVLGGLSVKQDCLIIAADSVSGLRKVYPYHFNYKTYAKERWFGVPLVSVFLKEFRNYSADKIVCVIFSSLIGVSLYTVFRKTHPLAFSFISQCIMCKFKQKLQ